MMDRREALSAMSLLMGGTIIGAEAFLSGCTPKKSLPVDGKIISLEDMAFLDEIGETIIPTTNSSPGAKAAKIGEFMESYVRDCYSQEEQDTFTNGISTFKEVCKSKTNKDFTSLTPVEQYNFLLEMEKEAGKYDNTKGTNDPENHYYSMYKQLTVFGYMTSEIGATQAMRHVAVPGRFEGCIPMEPGEKAWS